MKTYKKIIRHLLQVLMVLGTAGLLHGITIKMVNGQTSNAQTKQPAQVAHSTPPVVDLVPQGPGVDLEQKNNFEPGKLFPEQAVPAELLDQTEIEETLCPAPHFQGPEIVIRPLLEDAPSVKPIDEDELICRHRREYRLPSYYRPKNTGTPESNQNEYKNEPAGAYDWSQRDSSHDWGSGSGSSGGHAMRPSDSFGGGPSTQFSGMEGGGGGWSGGATPDLSGYFGGQMGDSPSADRSSPLRIPENSTVSNGNGGGSAPFSRSTTPESENSKSDRSDESKNYHEGILPMISEDEDDEEKNEKEKSEDLKTKTNPETLPDGKNQANPEDTGKVVAENDSKSALPESSNPENGEGAANGADNPAENANNAPELPADLQPAYAKLAQAAQDSANGPVNEATMREFTRSIGDWIQTTHVKAKGGDEAAQKALKSYHLFLDSQLAQLETAAQELKKAGKTANDPGLISLNAMRELDKFFVQLLDAKEGPAGKIDAKKPNGAPNELHRDAGGEIANGGTGEEPTIWASLKTGVYNLVQNLPTTLLTLGASWLTNKYWSRP